MGKGSGKSYDVPVVSPAKSPAGAEDGEEGDDDDGSRQSWGAHIEFVLTLVGYAVGLGNVWRFPYLTYANGGGAFLVPYFLMLALIGMPIFYMEVALGQFSSLGPITIWKVNVLMKGIGWSMVVTCTLISIYYSIIIAWSFYYFFASMTAAPMPWETCSNEWNNPACITSDEAICIRNQNYTGEFEHNNVTFQDIRELETASEQYYYYGVLQISNGFDKPDGMVWLLFLALVVVWVLTYLVLIRGIKSLGKVVYFSSLFPYVLITIMLIRGVTLEGASKGIEFYLIPDWNRLTDATVWSQAATQIFYSLGCCYGVLMAMSSYNNFKNNCLRDAIAIPLINCGTSFYAGFAIFSVLGFMAHRQGVSVDEVATEGPGLVFVVYPEALAQMPVPQLWSVLFFLMLLTLGFSSQFSMVECWFAALADEFPVLNASRKNNMIFRTVFMVLFFLMATPFALRSGFYTFNIWDIYLGGFPLLIIGLSETLVISWWYGYKNFAEDISMMLGYRCCTCSIWFRAMWQFITPAVLFVVIIFMTVQWAPPTIQITATNLYEFPIGGHVMGWMLVGVCLCFIPVMFAYYYCKDAGYKNCCTAHCLLRSEPDETWGPALDKNREGRYAPLKASGGGPTFRPIDEQVKSSTHSFTNAAFVQYDLK